jgi:hypothetical protein
MARETESLLLLLQGKNQEAQEKYLQSLGYLGSDHGAHLGWLRLTPLSQLIGEQRLLNLIQINGELDDLGFKGRRGCFLEDYERLKNTGKKSFYDNITKNLRGLLEKQKDSLLRLLSFRGQVELIIRPCVYWILSEGELPREIHYLASPGTFLNQVGTLITIEKEMETKPEKCQSLLESLLSQSRHLPDEDYPDVLALTARLYFYLGEGEKGEIYMKRAERIFGQSRQNAQTAAILSRLRSWR